MHGFYCFVGVFLYIIEHVFRIYTFNTLILRILMGWDFGTWTKQTHTHVLFSDWQLVYDGFYGVWSTFTQIFSFDPHYSCVMRDRSRSLWNIKWCTSRSQILNGIWKSKWRLLAISGASSSTPYSWSSFFPPLYWDITDI